MRTSLAWANLLHDKVRSIVAVAGVTFAIVLILMQLGFFGSVNETATLIYSRLNFDLILISPNYRFFTQPGTIPQTRLFQAQSLPEVARADPLHVGINLWKNAQTGRRRGIMLLGFRPQDAVFNLREIAAQADAVKLEGRVLADVRSRPEFGDMSPGVRTDIGGRPVEVVGQFALGTGFGADGAVAMSDRTFASLIPQRAASDVSLGLIRLQPGADPVRAAEALDGLLPDDVLVLTRGEIEAREREHWVERTSVGVIFGLGVVVALIVGVALVYQVLSSDVTEHMPEYATLKAMGYRPAYLAQVVLQQALILAVMGFIPGFLVAWGLYQAVANLSGVPLTMSIPRAAGVFGFAVAMCVVAGLLSLRKVLTSDPADVF